MTTNNPTAIRLPPQAAGWLLAVQQMLECSKTAAVRVALLYGSGSRVEAWQPHCYKSWAWVSDAVVQSTEDGTVYFVDDVPDGAIDASSECNSVLPNDINGAPIEFSVRLSEKDWSRIQHITKVLTLAMPWTRVSLSDVIAYSLLSAIQNDYRIDMLPHWSEKVGRGEVEAGASASELAEIEQ